MSEVVDKRVVLVGITGAGKSSLGCLLANEDLFVTSNRPNRVTKTGQQAVIEHNGAKITLVDTVGLLDTDDSQVVVRSKITDAIKKAAMGVDVFMLVVKLGRITEADLTAFNFLMDGILGSASLKNAILVVTHADEGMVGKEASAVLLQQKWIESAKSEESNLAALLEDINCRIHFVFNPPKASNAALEQIYSGVRENCRDELLQTIIQFNQPPYRIESIAKAQDEYDTELKRLELAKQNARTQEDKAMVERAIQEITVLYNNKMSVLMNQLNDERKKRERAEHEAKKKRKGKGFFGKLGKALDALLF